jgi:hypothetical protein
MVAPKSRFPLVRYALLVCSYDELGTQADFAAITLRVDCQPSGIAQGWPRPMRERRLQLSPALGPFLLILC